METRVLQTISSMKGFCRGVPIELPMPLTYDKTCLEGIGNFHQKRHSTGMARFGRTKEAALI
jgi:hypothetical protein